MDGYRCIKLYIHIVVIISYIMGHKRYTALNLILGMGKINDKVTEIKY